MPTVTITTNALYTAISVSVSLHGTHCPNTSVLNLTFVLFRKLLKTHLFNLAFNVYTDILVFSIWLLQWNAPMFST